MKNLQLSVLIFGLISGGAFAQNRSLARVGLPYLRSEDTHILLQQSGQFFRVIEPMSERLGRHAVNVLSSGRIVSRGTVVKNGIFTKWSELAQRGGLIQVMGFDGKLRNAAVKAVYSEYDLALLDYVGELPPVDAAPATSNDTLKVGEFLFAVGPSKEAHGFGIVSVLSRSLRESDKAYLGVRMGFNPITGGGVRIEWVDPDTSAARAGLLAGDIVTAIDGKKVNGIHEMGNDLQILKPGQKIRLDLRRGKKNYTIEVILGARPDMQKYSPKRMNEMKRMGGTINHVAEGFPGVLQSDMQVRAVDAGGPVFDLDGEFVGLIVARASRIKTYIIPAEKLAELQLKKPDMVRQGNSEVGGIANGRKGDRQPSAAEANEIRRLRTVIERARRRILEIEAGN